MLSVEFLLSCEATLEERLRISEREYIDALTQATTYRMLLLTALPLWSADRERADKAEERLRQFLGATPMHPDNDDDSSS